MEFKEIANNIYACLQEDKGFGWNNAGFINLGGGLVVDTFYDLPRTRRMKDEISRVADRPVKYLVNTHHNGDHVWGNQVFKDSEIIAHRLCAQEMEKEKDAGIVGLFQGLQAGGPENAPPGMGWFLENVREFDYAGIELTLPNRLIDDRLDLDLDGVPCEIVYVGPAHTSNDMIVHLPQQKVVFAGDILFWKCTPVGWEGTHAKWLEASDFIASLKPDVIVPGHGPLCGVDELMQQRDYFERIYDQAKRLYDQGVTEPIEACKKLDLEAYREWTQPERVIWTVARAFRDFKGEPWDAPFGDAITLIALARQLAEYWDSAA
ncbi:MAG: MBL fold metallo-hydrolase [Proteobacteria bacterium]|nr:MBL fold metallo-hydrolase [Pseudomonadota bacterium]